MRVLFGLRALAWILTLAVAGVSIAKEPALIWQTRIPIVLKDDGDHHLLSLRQADGSLLIVTSSATNVSPRIVSPEGQVVGRSEIPSGQALWDVALDPWGGVTIQGNLCDSCSGDVLKYDARTGLPRWPAAFRAESAGLVGVTPAGDVIVRTAGKTGLLDGRTGALRWSGPLAISRTALTSTRVFGIRVAVEGGLEAVSLLAESGVESWRAPVPSGPPATTEYLLFARDAGDLVLVTSSPDGMTLIVMNPETGAPLSGPVTLPRATLPADAFRVVVEQGGDGSLAVAAEFQVPAGGLLMDVGLWRVSRQGTVVWGPVVYASPSGSRSSDRVGGLAMDPAGEVFLSGFRGADSVGSGPTSRGFLTRLAADDGHVRWEVPRSGEEARAYQYFGLHPDGPEALDVVASGAIDDAAVRIFRFSAFDGSQLRPRIFVDGRMTDSPGTLAFQADSGRVRVAALGSELRRFDLATESGAPESATARSRHGYGSDALLDVTSSGGTVIAAGGTLWFQETPLSVRWKSSIALSPNSRPRGLLTTGTQAVVMFSDGHDCGVEAHSLETGERVWGPVTFPSMDSWIQRLPDGDVLLIIANGPAQRRLLRLRSDTGAVVWDRAPAPGVVSPSLASVSVDEVGISILWRMTLNDYALERRLVTDGQLAFAPKATVGGSLVGSTPGSTYVVSTPSYGAWIVRRYDNGDGSIVWSTSLSFSNGVSAYRLLADSTNAFFLYGTGGAGSSGAFVEAFRVADGARAASPIRVGPWGVARMELVPGSGLVVAVPGPGEVVVSRIDEALAFGPADGVLPAVDCGVPLDLDLGLRNGDGGEAWSFASPVGERPPGLTLTSAGRLVGTPRTGSYIFRVRVSGSQGSLERTLSLQVRSAHRPMTVARSSTSDACPGSVVLLTAPPGFTSYEWSTGEAGESISVSPQTSTTYFVRAVDASGCDAEGSVYVAVSSDPAPFLVGPRNAIPGEEFEVSVEGGSGIPFLWEAVNGIVLSGQGTHVVRVRAGSNGTCAVRAERIGAMCTPQGATLVEVRRPTGLYTVMPCRAFDTRLPEGRNGGPSLLSGYPVEVFLAGVCGVPATASAVAVNVTLIPTGSYSGAAICAEGGPCAPSLEGPPGTTRTSSAIVKLPPDGSGRLLAYPWGVGGDLIVDISGYFE